MKAQVLSKTKVTDDAVSASQELSKASVLTLAVVAIGFGIWSMVAFVAGAIASGGVVGLIQSWFTAIGM